jgi:hypothetical protein
VKFVPTPEMPMRVTKQLYSLAIAFIMMRLTNPLIERLPGMENKITLQEEISVIGYMCDKEEGAKLITKGKNLFDITAQGWNAFGK